MKRISAACLFFLPLLFSVATQPASASLKVIAPENIPGTTKVDAVGMLDLAENYKHLIIIDSRIRQDRTQGYIEGSISLPDVDTTCDSLQKIVSDKKNPVLFYCNGPKCGRSVTASRIALACGYRKVYWYRGGFEHWKANNYPYLKE